MEGYWDGFDDAPEPRPGGNRSRSYWHGWKCGMADAHRLEPDAVHDRLVHDYVERQNDPRRRVVVDPAVAVAAAMAAVSRRKG
jgi:hypothetical protein